MSTDTTIAVIEKSKTTDLRVRLAEFHGKTDVDLRTIVVVDAAERAPTKKGIAIPPALLPKVIAALVQAEEKLRADGLIAEGSKAA